MMRLGDADFNGQFCISCKRPPSAGGRSLRAPGGTPHPERPYAIRRDRGSPGTACLSHDYLAQVGMRSIRRRSRALPGGRLTARRTNGLRPQSRAP